MKIRSLRLPIAGTPRSTPLLLALSSLAALVAARTLVPAFPPGSTDPIAALEATPVVVAAALAIALRLLISRPLGGTLAAAMTLCLVLAASGALLQAALATGIAAAVASVSAIVFLVSALLVLDVALVRLAPARFVS